MSSSRGGHQNHSKIASEMWGIFSLNKMPCKEKECGEYKKKIKNKNKNFCKPRDN